MKTLQWILLSEFEIFINLYIPYTIKRKRSVFSMIMKSIRFFIEISTVIVSFSIFYLILFELYSFEMKKRHSYFTHCISLKRLFIRQCVCVFLNIIPFTSHMHIHISIIVMLTTRFLSTILNSNINLEKTNFIKSEYKNLLYVCTKLYCHLVTLANREMNLRPIHSVIRIYKIRCRAYRNRFASRSNFPLINLKKDLWAYHVVLLFGRFSSACAARHQPIELSCQTRSKTENFN